MSQGPDSGAQRRFGTSPKSAASQFVHHHGFRANQKFEPLRILLTVSPERLRGRYTTVPRPQKPWRHGPTEEADSFVLNLRTHQVQ